MISIIGKNEVQKYIIREIQDIYASQGQIINCKHIEVIIRQMFSRMRIVNSGDTNMLRGEVIEKTHLWDVNEKLNSAKKPAVADEILLGISRVALSTNSFLSAASFQETTNVLIDAATTGKIDKLRGLKENVIIGKLIPSGTGFAKSKIAQDLVKYYNKTKK